MSVSHKVCYLAVFLLNLTEKEPIINIRKYLGVKFMQKAVIVTGFWNSSDEKWNDTTDEINSLLEDGWKVVQVSPMGAYGYGYGRGESLNDYDVSDNGFASIVILEKN
jgi:hypothetical protein